MGRVVGFDGSGFSAGGEAIVAGGLHGKYLIGLDDREVVIAEARQGSELLHVDQAVVGDYVVGDVDAHAIDRRWLTGARAGWWFWELCFQRKSIVFRMWRH